MARAFGSNYVFAVTAILCSTASPESVQCDLVDDDGGDVEKFGTDLIQQQRKLLHTPAERESLPELPIYWVHVPRTGDSFAYTLCTMKDLCGEFTIPEDRPLTQVKVDYVQRRCFGITVDDRCPKFMNYGECAENSVGGTQYQQAKGRIVGFFRHPEVRLLSDYKHSNKGGQSAQDLLEWIPRYLGCHTKKLTWNGNGLLDGDWHCEGDPPTWDEVDQAKQIVRNDYVFIGMTDDWDTSICLFNNMFANTPRRIQFQNYANHTTSSSEDLSWFNGFVDPYDTPLWNVALNLFKKSLVRYDVSDETCEVPSE